MIPVIRHKKNLSTVLANNSNQNKNLGLSNELIKVELPP